MQEQTSAGKGRHSTTTPTCARHPDERTRNRTPEKGGAFEMVELEFRRHESVVVVVVRNIKIEKIGNMEEN